MSLAAGRREQVVLRAGASGMSAAERATLDTAAPRAGAGGVVPARRGNLARIHGRCRHRDVGGDVGRCRYGLDRRQTMEAVVPGHRLLALHQLHAVPELLPLRRLRRLGRQEDPGPESEQLQDRLSGLLARLSGSGDHVPEVPPRTDQRRGGHLGRCPARGDEGRHLGAARAAISTRCCAIAASRPSRGSRRNETTTARSRSVRTA